ncbi:MAG: ABC transporter permease [Acidimicrobiaceae bacterium]|nr:ABC transporter permease [Acidimicrobiaceae bacterium]
MSPTDSPNGSASTRRPGTDDKPWRVVTAKETVWERLRELWRFRELLAAMTRQQFRVQYKDSVLGLLWSLLNPATTLLVYFVVFQLILKNGIPRFAIYLMSGLLVWNFFSVSLVSSCASVVGNAGIVKKVAFPREIPALASIGSALIQMGLQAIVMVLFMFFFWHGPAVAYLPLLVPALAAVILLGAAFGVLLAAVNVRYRDTQHLLAVAINVWFWATSIVYPFRMVRDKVFQFVAGQSGMVLRPNHEFWFVLWILWRLNPVTPIVLTFQRTLYAATSPKGQHGAVIHILPDHANQLWYLWQLGLVLLFAVVVLGLALKLFSRMEGHFAEDL